MQIEKLLENHTAIADVFSEETVVTDVSSALDLIMSALYAADAKKIVINKEAFAREFFILSSGLAGEVLQKFINYQVKVAIYGDYSGYTSKPLKDFIYESNKGKDIFFQDSLEAALDKLTNA